MFKKISLILLFSFLLANTTFANNYIEKTIDWFKFRVIKFDTKSKDYIFKVWANPDYSATNLRELMEANNGISAINGVFFCPSTYKECWWKNFTKNERYVEWNKIWPEQSTGDRVVFAIDKNNRPFLYQTDKINTTYEWDINYWFANFPLLLQDWVSKFQDYNDLWLIDKKMTSKSSRNFICSDKTSRYIYTWYVSNIGLKKLPDLLIKFGCYNALNLDAGGSSAMIYNSRYLIWPGRDIMDWVIIERIGLDTKKIIESSLKIKSIMEVRIADKTYSEKILFLDNLSSGLSKIRTKIYEKYSNDLYKDADKIWYEINVTNVNKLQTIYIVNYLNKLFNEMKKNYLVEENNRVQLENNRIEFENNSKNTEELLF